MELGMEFDVVKSLDRKMKKNREPQSDSKDERPGR